MGGTGWRIGNVRFERIEKPGGFRLLSHLDPMDARRYEALLRPVTPRIEASLSNVVMANRAGPRGSLGPAAPARRAWRRRVIRTIAGERRPYTLVSDVASFYASVGERAVTRALGGIDGPGTETGLLSFLGALWDAGVTGLPVGPEPSAILANAVLAHADDAVLSAGASMVRWVDDVVIVASGRATAIRAFAAWAAALAEVGLAPNPSKTRSFDDPAEALRILMRTRRSGAMR